MDNVTISQRVYDTWLLMCSSTIARLVEQYPDIIVEDIPDESFILKKDGNGCIYIRVRNVDIKLNVPKEEFNLKK